MNSDSIVAAIDIGSSKITAALAQVTLGTGFKIITSTEVASHGIKKGNINQIDLLQHTIDIVIDQLEAAGNCQIHSVICSLSGTNIMSYNADATIDIKNRVIRDHDIIRVISEAESSSRIESRHTLHTLLQEYIVDHQTGIEQPIGLTGDLLEARVHIINTAKTSYQNLQHLFLHRDIDLEYAISSNISSALASLRPNEKELGVCMLDIGAGTTELTVFNAGKIKHSEVIPFGGELISKDIAYFMLSEFDDAEDIKKRTSLSINYTEREQFEVKGSYQAPSKYFLKKEIANVISERCNQLTELVMQKLIRAGFEDSFPAGFVLCGGGAKLQGIESFIQRKTGLPTRISVPEINDYQQFQDPKYTNIIGLFTFISSEDYMKNMTNNTKRGIIASLRSTFKIFKQKVTDNF